MAGNFKNMAIKCRAAVCWGAKKPLKIENIEVAPPKAKEVRIKIAATGLCHTDYFVLNGGDPNFKFPVILGHEGCGVVESVGEGVTSVKSGDHVIPLWIPQCGKCKFCRSNMTNLCNAFLESEIKGVMADGTTRFSCNGQPISHFMATSTLSEYTVLPEISVCKVNPKAPMDKICLLGCGITTGYGAAVRSANVTKGSSCAVWGLGCIGLAAVMGCHNAGAKRIIAIDPNPAKFELAKLFGATECINPNEIKGKTLQEHLIEITDGGLDFTFEACGRSDVMRVALESCHKGWGKSYVMGISGDDISTQPGQLVTGRMWTGAAFGGYKSKDELPGLVDDYMDGKIKIDEFITHNIKLEDVNKGFEMMHNGIGLRTIVHMDAK